MTIILEQDPYDQNDLTKQYKIIVRVRINSLHHFVYTALRLPRSPASHSKAPSCSEDFTCAMGSSHSGHPCPTPQNWGKVMTLGATLAQWSSCAMSETEHQKALGYLQYCIARHKYCTVESCTSLKFMYRIENRL